PVDAVAFSPDGRLLAVGGYRQIRLLDVSSTAPGLQPGTGSRTIAVLSGASGPVTSLAFSPDGRLLASAGGAPAQFGEVQLWDVRKRRLMRTLRGHRDALYSVAISPDGRTLAAASYDHLVSLWPLAGGRPRMLKDHIDAVYAVA